MTISKRLWRHLWVHTLSQTGHWHMQRALRLPDRSSCFYNNSDASHPQFRNPALLRWWTVRLFLLRWCGWWASPVDGSTASPCQTTTSCGPGGAGASSVWSLTPSLCGNLRRYLQGWTQAAAHRFLTYLIFIDQIVVYLFDRLNIWQAGMWFRYCDIEVFISFDL